MTKGNKVELMPTALENRFRAYAWCIHFETTKYHCGPPDYPENPILTYA